MALPRVLVDDVTHAVPADFGILSPAATVVYDSTTHWAAGFGYETLDCNTTVRLSSLCSAASGVIAVEPGDPDLRWRDTLPFNIETEFTASTMGTRNLDFEARAQQRMEACQQKAVEFEFWTGALARQEQDQWTADGNTDTVPTRFLASDSAVDLTPTAGTAVKVKHGLALLEQALGDCGCGVRGTIHTTRGTASALGLSASDAVLRTTLGNVVIAGSGYTGSGPDGTQPTGTAAWMYATGPVTVRLGAITATPGRPNRSQSVDISRNEVQVFAERPAAVTWDTCCHYAVLVDLSLDYS